MRLRMHLYRRSARNAAEGNRELREFSRIQKCALPIRENSRQFAVKNPAVTNRGTKITRPAAAAARAARRTAAAARSLARPTAGCRSGCTASASSSKAELSASAVKTKPMQRAMAIHSPREIPNHQPSATAATAAAAWNRAFRWLASRCNTPRPACPKAARNPRQPFRRNEFMPCWLYPRTAPLKS